MQPIVDRLREQYREQIAFIDLNAADSADGQRVFERLALPGHPSFVIFSAAGQEQFRAFGIVETVALTEAIETALRP
jgi:hypothetical protein